ncbi:acyl-[acyl-carrier-protein] thioesterase [Cyclonatronum proteinivorum]|nr:acyl-ACP thioesterase domain-containing protein [Cyclonatronum proteinivorum]
MQPFIFSHTVRTFETDARGLMTVSSLLNILQYGAGKHAGELGWSVRALHNSGKTWVLQRFTVEMNELPADGDTITLTTYPSGSDKLLAYRDYKVEDASGKVLVLATSAWVILDLRARRVTPIPDTVSAISTRFGPKLKAKPGTRLTDWQPEADEKAPVFRVRRHDMDLNGHLTNVTYAEWGLEAVPEEIFSKGQLKEIDIVFKAESFFNDRISSHLRTSAVEGSADIRFQHMLRRESDQKVTALMETSWQKP